MYHRVRLIICAFLAIMAVLAVALPAYADGVVKPTVTTGAATLMSYTTVQFNGNITATGGADCKYRGFEWGTTTLVYDHSKITGSFWKTQYGTGAFAMTMTGLRSGVTYYYRAKAKNSAGWSYGAEETFTLLSFEAPTVTTAEAANVTTTTALLGGNVTDTGGTKCTLRGFEWGTSTGVYTSSWLNHSNAGTGAFAHTQGKLLPDTDYYYRALAYHLSSAIPITFAVTGNGSSSWVVGGYQGHDSVKMSVPTESDYTKVIFPITGDFETEFAPPDFWYKISPKAVASTEDLGATWPIYERLGQTVAKGYLSPYIVIKISDGNDTHYIISQPLVESTKGGGWKHWTNDIVTHDYTEMCWHDELFTDIQADGYDGGPTDAGWETLAALQSLYSGFDILEVSIGYGNFTGVHGAQIAYVDNCDFNGSVYFLEKTGTFAGLWGYGAEKTFTTDAMPGG